MSHRPFKDRLYAEFATIGKALASAHRLELLDVLGQPACLLRSTELGEEDDTHNRGARG